MNFIEYKLFSMKYSYFKCLLYIDKRMMSQDDGVKGYKTDH